jgi:NAD+ synthase (glutamine-hydrolysing)
MDGFIRVSAVTPPVTPGDPVRNADRIIDFIKELDTHTVNIAVFPELCITGYTCGDMFLNSELSFAAIRQLHRIADETAKTDVTAVVGLPVIVSGKLLNAAAVVYHGEILQFTAKKHIPNYNEFYEARYFVGESELDPMFADGALTEISGGEMGEGFRSAMAVEICEDLWMPVPPSCDFCALGATIICNLSASNAVIGKDIYRRDLVKAHSARTVSAYIYANAGPGESTTDCVYDGQSFIAENGVILAESKRFTEGFIIADIDVLRLTTERMRMSTFKTKPTPESKASIVFPKRRLERILRDFPKFPFVPSDDKILAERCEYILDMQAHALAKRLSAIGCKTAVIGLSGGLDSTLALLVTVRAFDILRLPHSGIITITMPCFGTTPRTKSNAEKLGAAFGTDFRTINITAAVKQHFSDIGLPETDRTTAFENVQARERTQILMDTANMSGGIVIGTGDLSELALGFATYNGDHMSMYGVNSGVPKTLVRYLVRFVSNEARISQNEVQQDEARQGDNLADVLDDILDTPVSPELLPADEGAQHTESIVGPYELHDFFLYYFVRTGFSPEKILRIACQTWGDVYDRKTIKKWLAVFIKRFFSQQFKRSCLPDGVKIGSVSLSPRADFRMPSDMSSAFLGEL